LHATPRWSSSYAFCTSDGACRSDEDRAALSELQSLREQLVGATSAAAEVIEELARLRGEAEVLREEVAAGEKINKEQLRENEERLAATQVQVGVQCACLGV